jgi:erythritol transport system ATP-binding protein
MSDSELILEAKGVVRRYLGNVALKGVNFRLHRGKVNVLIGENGAGKSTLMRILAGVERPDEGAIYIDGEQVEIRSPREASALGIAIVHQELSALPNLDVSENIFAGRELVRAAMVVNRAEEDRRGSAAMTRLRHSLPVTQPVSQLSLGARQMVELARSLAHGARILILDEPTSALSQTEAETLFGVVEELKAAGVTIVYISHRLHELLHLGDYFTVFRSGEVVGEGAREDVTRSWIVERMSGRKEAEQSRRPVVGKSVPVALNVEGVSVGPAGSLVYDISFLIRKGEILGIYGLLGAGRTELLEALAGCRAMSAGQVAVNGSVVKLRRVNDAMQAGLVLIPEDRGRDGLIPEMSIRENVALAGGGGIVLSRAEETVRVKELVKRLQIAAHDIELPVMALSGGNQQKVLLARCLLRKPVVLMMDEPTRGVDVGAKAEIYKTLRALADEGLSVLFASSEIEETRSLADRVLVMCQGRIAAELYADEATDETLFSFASPRVAAVQDGEAPWQ